VSVLVHFLADLVRALRMLPAIVWDALADACLTDGRGSVLDGMWLTDGDLAVDVAAIRLGVHPVPMPELPEGVTVRLVE
jgi:hypothetical protein